MFFRLQPGPVNGHIAEVHYLFNLKNIDDGASLLACYVKSGINFIGLPQPKVGFKTLQIQITYWTLSTVQDFLISWVKPCKVGTPGFCEEMQ